jgi:hypothetical protein
MSIKLMIGITILHSVLGIVFPSLYLIFKRLELINIPYSGLVSAWIFLSWGLFFASASIFIASNYVIGMRLGGIVAVLIGVLPLGILALFSFYQLINTNLAL